MKSAAPSTVTPLRDFSDRLSPMVVKELRHGLRTRYFTTSLICFHWLLLMLMGSTLVGVSTERVNQHFWTLALVSMLGVLPLRGFTALAGEMTAGTLDMLTLTSISSFRIVFGKWASLFSQSLLLACSLLPYLVARYHFGGVEIFREAVGLLILLLGSALATAAFVAFSSQTTRAMRSLLVLALAAGLFPLGAFVFVIARESPGDEMIREFLLLPVWQRGALTGGILAVAVYGVYFFLAMGASRIAPASENHSTRKRIVALVVLAALTAAGCVLRIRCGPAEVLWAFVPALILTLLNGMDVLTESTPRIPTVVLPFVRRYVGYRTLGTLLYPGWSSGVFFYIVLASMPMTLALLMSSGSGKLPSEGAMAMACFLLAPLVPVSLCINRKDRFTHWWTVQFIFISAGILMLVFGGVTGSRGVGMLGIFTPVTALFGSIIGGMSANGILALGVAFSIIWGAGAVAFAFDEMPKLRALEAEAFAMSRSKPKPSSEA